MPFILLVSASKSPDYDELAVYGDRLHAIFYQCKGKQLTADVAYGSIELYKADLQKAELHPTHWKAPKCPLFYL